MIVAFAARLFGSMYAGIAQSNLDIVRLTGEVFSFRIPCTQQRSPLASGSCPIETRAAPGKGEAGWNRGDTRRPCSTMRAVGTFS